jgi:hypothetical protein
MADKETPEEVTFNSLGQALEFIQDKNTTLGKQMQQFEKNFEELTGFKPGHRVTALDVVAICYKFYGEPKGD